MPACPIKAHTVAPTKTPFNLPFENTLGDGISIAGTVQVTDQNGFTVTQTHYAAGVHDTGVDWSRTVETTPQFSGSLSFDKGCTKTDPYGSNNCHWDFG